jgi:hypothetical protein
MVWCSVKEKSTGTILPLLLGTNILLSTLSSDTLNLCSSLHVRGQDLHPYKKHKNIVLYILIFKLLERRQEDKRM